MYIDIRMNEFVQIIYRLEKKLQNYNEFTKIIRIK